MRRAGRAGRAIVLPPVRRARFLVAGSVLALSALVAGRAHAHGGRPQTQGIFFAEDDPDRIVARATFGILTSEDGGASWSWTCQESMPDGVAGVVQPALLVADDRLLVAGTFGLLRGERAGCEWQRDAALLDRYTADVVRSSDRAIFAITGDSSSASNSIFESTDEGLSFHAIGAPFPLRFLSERIRVAPSDPSRIYVSGQAFVEGTTDVRGVLLRSDDRGESWTELEVPLLPDERLVRVVDVDPADPDVAWLVISGQETDRVLRAAGAGTAITEALGMLADPMPYQRPFGYARAPDGTIWFGNTREGLTSIAPDGTVTLVDKYLAVGCLAVQGEHLYLCGNGGDDGFAIGRTPWAGPYAGEPVARFGAIERRICAARVDCVCASWWDDFQVETIPDASVEGLDGGVCAPEELDGGTLAADAGTDGGIDGGSPSPPPSTCACTAVHRRAPWWMIGLAVAAVAARRRV